MNGNLASDANNTQFVGASDPDSVLIVGFYNKAVQDNFETEKQNRPVFRDVVYIQIYTPGNQLNIVDRPMYGVDKERFPKQWAHYMNTHGEGGVKAIGMPLEQWSLLTAAQCAELKALKFLTVEQIAKASDAQLATIHMIAGMAPSVLQIRARALLQSSVDTALPQLQASELAKRDEEIASLKAKDAERDEQFKALQEQLAAITNGVVSAPKRRGRPPKVQVEA